MRIYTKAGDLAFSTFTFPDGQPHFKLETYEVEFRSVVVETAIRNPTELLQTLLVAQVLRQHGYSEINLDIRYLLGARMDRAIGSNEPFTLECVARLINSCGFSRVRILDVHSDVALRLIRNSVNILPFSAVNQVFSALPQVKYVVAPDKGAVERVSKLSAAHVASRNGRYIQATKFRELSTGKLYGMEVVGAPGETGWDCLVIDDICDGGATFVELARQLHTCGAGKVYLYVTHGIFSKSHPEGIDTIYTTNSFRGDTYGFERFVCIPVSMKELA